MQIRSPILTLLLALAPLASPLLTPARADEAADDQTPAGKAYREAWWAETSGGNLTQALDLYAKVLEAEGSPALKAQALFRRALVLQRIGKTEEAIRALERLAKDFPGEAALQAEARARLSEWTAVDLKTSFEEWFRRYRFSPEFQAKIVDLVLKLGASDGAVSQAAYGEVLTIGEPALPALRQHLGSANPQLHDRVVSALLALKEVPSADALRRAGTWRNDWNAWRVLTSAPPEVRARLKAELDPNATWDQGLNAALDGPASVLRWARATGPDVPWESRRPFVGFMDLPPKESPEATALVPLLREIAVDPAAESGLRESVLPRLVTLGGLGTQEAGRWLAQGDPLLRVTALNALTQVGSGPDSMLALRRSLEAARAWPDALRWRIATGVFAGLDRLPADEPLSALADDLVALIANSGGQGPSGSFGAGAQTPRQRDVLAHMVDRSTDGRLANTLLSFWIGPRVFTAPDLERLAGWVRAAPLEEVRVSAAYALATTAGDAQRRAVALAAEADLSADTRWRLCDLLLRSAASVSILSDPQQRRALLTAARRAEDQAGYGSLSGALINIVERSATLRHDLALDFLVDPEAFPRSLLLGEASPRVLGSVAGGLQPGALRAWAAELATLTGAWAKAWASTSWSAAQRDAAIAGLPALSPQSDPALRPVLRAALRDASNGISAASRTTLMRLIAPLTLDDVRAVFDLATPEGSDAAVAMLWANDMPDPTPSVELLDALHLGLRPQAPSHVIRTLVHAHAGLPEAQPRLVEAQLNHRDSAVQSNGVAALIGRESSDDLPLWLKALALPDPAVRVLVAKGLGRLTHPEATKALVRALDDPSSQVRDAAIESLEAIQKIEELKARWREKVR